MVHFGQKFRANLGGTIQFHRYSKSVLLRITTCGGQATHHYMNQWWLTSFMWCHTMGIFQSWQAAPSPRHLHRLSYPGLLVVSTDCPLHEWAWLKCTHWDVGGHRTRPGFSQPYPWLREPRARIIHLAISEMGQNQTLDNRKYHQINLFWSNFAWNWSHLAKFGICYNKNGGIRSKWLKFAENIGYEASAKIHPWLRKLGSKRDPCGRRTPSIAHFDLNWAFPDCNSSLNSPMATEFRKLFTSVFNTPFPIQLIINCTAKNLVTYTLSIFTLGRHRRRRVLSSFHPSASPSVRTAMKQIVI